MNFVSGRTDGLISTADSSPSVAIYSLLYSDTAGASTIQHFDDGEEGQIIYLFNINDGAITFSSGSIKCADSSRLMRNETITFMNHLGIWHELSRSHNQGNQVVTSAQSDSSPSVRNTVLLVLNNSTSNCGIKDFDDGYEGQMLTVINLSNNVVLQSAASNVIITSNTNNTLQSGNTLTFIRKSNAWYETGRSQMNDTTTHGFYSPVQGDASPSVLNVHTLILSSTGKTTIKNLSDGTQGQEVMILKTGSSYSILDHGNGQFWVGATAQDLQLHPSSMCLVKRVGDTWYVIGREQAD